MNEPQDIEHQESGNIRANIRTISTAYGEMRTISLQRVWETKDGERRYADDMRARDVVNAIALLEQFASEEGQGSPRSKRVPVRRMRSEKREAFPFKRQLSDRELASTDPQTWKYDSSELGCWKDMVRQVAKHPDDTVRCLLA